MADRHGARLEGARRDVERHIELPDFDPIARRGLRLRRQRTIAVTGAAAVLVLVLATAVAHPWTPEKSAPPSVPVVGRGDPSAILADPAAQVDNDRWVVADTGAVIDTVSVALDEPDPLDCGDDQAHALVWSSADGTTRAWTEQVPARFVLARAGGFVISAVAPRCRTGEPGEDLAYVVDAAGRRTPVSWTGDPGSCAERPDRPRCLVDVATATGRLVDRVGTGTPPGSGAVPLGGGDGDRVWARSVDSRRIYWSQDGGLTWRQHTTTLTGARSENVQVTAAGDWMVFARGMRMEYSSDSGSTWQTRDLETALQPILVAAELWAVMPSGVLLGITQPVGSRSILFHSADDSWSTFKESSLTTAYGTTVPRVAGEWAYVRDVGRGWISRDGEHWISLDPLQGDEPDRAVQR